MSRLRRMSFFLELAILCAFLAASSLLLIPIHIETGAGEMNAFSYLIAGVFWGGLILTQVFFWIAHAEKKKCQARGKRWGNFTCNNVGIITFGANLEALFCDIICGVSLAASIVLFYCRAQNAWLVTACLATLVFSLNLHSILNGSTYAFIKAVNKLKKERRGNERAGK